MTLMNLPDLPPKADILAEVYQPLPRLTTTVNWDTVDPSKIGLDVLNKLSAALECHNNNVLVDIFLDPLSYWRDTLALTAHLRTFERRDVIARNLSKLSKERGSDRFKVVLGSPQVLAADSSLKWVDCFFVFKTSSPEATCKGRLMLLPEAGEDETISWKIWTLSTWLEDFVAFPENESLLRAPSSDPTPQGDRTSVVIIGGGNGGLLLAARLKALGVDYLIIDQNKNIGDNWSQRYDCLRFHVGKSFCEMPYLAYPPDASNELTRDELASQIKRFAVEFDLQPQQETHVKETVYDQDADMWRLRLVCKGTERMVWCKCLVVATGVGLQGPYTPSILGSESYQGISIHSSHYTNPRPLIEAGVKSVLVIGSANTGFDIMEDCYDAGLNVTMIQRSPTYVIPMDYLLHPEGLGIFDYVPAETADAITQAGPLAVGGPLLSLVHAKQAATEPDRYAALAKAGFQFTNCTQSDLLVHLFQRCGGHFVDIGKGIELLSMKKVGIKSGATPKSYTTTGLKLSDGTTLDADAIIWCTGFRDVDIRPDMNQILGDGAEDIARKLEPTWNVDTEGEVRGLWKRHANIDNIWLFGGGTAQHRWYSKIIALQIKGVLEGILPEAYRN